MSSVMFTLCLCACFFCSTQCHFGSPFDNGATIFNQTFDASSSWRNVYNDFMKFANRNVSDHIDAAFNNFLQPSYHSDLTQYTFSPEVSTTTSGQYKEGQRLAAIRTCNSFFDPQPSISESDVARLFEGMMSARAEREDFIITPDLRGNVSHSASPLLQSASHSSPPPICLTFLPSSNLPHIPPLLQSASHSSPPPICLTFLPSSNLPHIPPLLQSASHSSPPPICLTFLPSSNLPHIPPLLQSASHSSPPPICLTFLPSSNLPHFPPLLHLRCLVHWTTHEGT